jgi:hypothetical protein
LDSTKRAADRTSDHLCKQGFANSRDVFDEEVAFGERRGNGDVDNGCFAGEYRVDRGSEAAADVCRGVCVHHHPGSIGAGSIGAGSIGAGSIIVGCRGRRVIVDGPWRREGGRPV